MSSFYCNFCICKVNYSMKKILNIPIESNETILLHVCCAPCAAGCVERLLEKYTKVALYYSNSNMCTQAEFELRLTYVKQLAEYFNISLYVDEYNHQAWLESCRSLRDEPEGGLRCVKCFEYSLSRTALAAQELGFSVFATSLTVSPRKNSETIFNVGRQWSNFREWNFKKESGYLTGLNLARELNFYRQSFCACEFSMRTTPPHSRQSE